MKIISCTNNKKASKYKDSRKNVVFMGVLKIRTNRVQVPSSAVRKRKPWDEWGFLF